MALAAPTKYWIVLPMQSVLTSTNNVITITPYATEDAAKVAAVRASMASGSVQYLVFEATWYASEELLAASLTGTQIIALP